LTKGAGVEQHAVVELGMEPGPWLDRDVPPPHGAFRESHDGAFRDLLVERDDAFPFEPARAPSPFFSSFPFPPPFFFLETVSYRGPRSLAGRRRPPPVATWIESMGRHGCCFFFPSLFFFPLVVRELLGSCRRPGAHSYLPTR